MSCRESVQKQWVDAGRVYRNSGWMQGECTEIVGWLWVCRVCQVVCRVRRNALSLAPSSFQSRRAFTVKPVVSSIYEYIAATEATTATKATAIVATVATTATATTVAKAGEPTTAATAVGTDQQEGFSMSSFFVCTCVLSVCPYQSSFTAAILGSGLSCNV